MDDLLTLNTLLRSPYNFVIWYSIHKSSGDRMSLWRLDELGETSGYYLFSQEWTESNNSVRRFVYLQS